MEEITSLEYYIHVLQQYKILHGLSLNQIKEMALHKEFPHDILYRGQPAKYNSIICGLPREQGYVSNENAMYRETIVTKWEDFKTFSYPIEYLTKMQHYGMPTRLVDFTINPFIALFFAVQDTVSKEDSIVYVYHKDCEEINSDSIKVLSLLPTLEEKTLEALQCESKSIFNLNFSISDLIEIVDSVKFVEFSYELKESNPRLNNQEGTFAVCGNNIIDDFIVDEICSVDISECYLKIKIAYQYKKTIKDELDLHFGINDNYVYPELTAWSDYIRMKYKNTSFDVQNAYSILITNDMSLTDIRRIEIKIVLNKQADVEEAKECIYHATEQYKPDYDVIWFYIATNGNNFITSNWMLQGQWISNDTSEYYSRVPFYELDERRFYWEYGLFSEREKYQSEEIFTDDRTLFLVCHHLFLTCYHHFHTLELSYEIQDYENFQVEVEKREHIIREISKKLWNLGRSRDNSFDSYMFYYFDFFVAMCDLTYWIKVNQIEWIDYRISKCFNIMRRSVSLIDADKAKWMSILAVTSDEIKESQYSVLIRDRLMFRQTIPISDNPLNITMTTAYSIVSDKLYIKGITNLYNYAKLLLTLSSFYAHDFVQKQAKVMEGEFEFVVELSELISDHYVVEITLSFPRTQDFQFIDKAGEEYENLGGDLIEHSGIDSTLYFKTRVHLPTIANASH